MDPIDDILGAMHVTSSMYVRLLARGAWGRLGLFGEGQALGSVERVLAVDAHRYLLWLTRPPSHAIRGYTIP